MRVKPAPMYRPQPIKDHGGWDDFNGEIVAVIDEGDRIVKIRAKVCEYEKPVDISRTSPYPVTPMMRAGWSMGPTEGVHYVEAPKRPDTAAVLARKLRAIEQQMAIDQRFERYINGGVVDTSLEAERDRVEKALREAERITR
jgi:hypothetical protein